MLLVEDLNVRLRGYHAVRDVCLTLSAGSLLGLLGPNGAGKTTTISALLGMVPCTAKRILLNGKDITDNLKAARSHVGYVPQSIALYEELSVGQNLQIWGGLQGLEGAQLKRRADYALELSGLRARHKDAVSELSGGMKRRLNLAVGLLHDPDVLICDEPTTGVDARSRQTIYEALRTTRDAGKAIIYTTHYLEEVEAICDEVAILDRGRTLTQGPVTDLLSTHRLNTRYELELTGPLQAEELSKALEQAGISGAQIRHSALSLEAVFLSLTEQSEEESK